jgi:hypothetical protein
MYCETKWSYFASGALLSCGIITSGGSGGVDRLVMFNGSQSSVPSNINTFKRAVYMILLTQD